MQAERDEHGRFVKGNTIGAQTHSLFGQRGDLLV
jgi:hypothetical protein